MDFIHFEADDLDQNQQQNKKEEDYLPEIDDFVDHSIQENAE